MEKSIKILKIIETICISIVVIQILSMMYIVFISRSGNSYPIWASIGNIAFLVSLFIWLIILPILKKKARQRKASVEPE